MIDKVLEDRLDKEWKNRRKLNETKSSSLKEEKLDTVVENNQEAENQEDENQEDENQEGSNYLLEIFNSIDYYDILKCCIILIVISGSCYLLFKLSLLLKISFTGFINSVVDGKIRSVKSLAQRVERSQIEIKNSQNELYETQLSLENTVNTIQKKQEVLDNAFELMKGQQIMLKYLNNASIEEVSQQAVKVAEDQEVIKDNVSKIMDLLVENSDLVLEVLKVIEEAGTEEEKLAINTLKVLVEIWKAKITSKD